MFSVPHTSLIQQVMCLYSGTDYSTLNKWYKHTLDINKLNKVLDELFE